ncbi:MAG: hypothetical protein IBJ09_04385 [Bacteroidia bacterium]|nr:hypothetical protein [Bacteroidia bacterium]
METLFTPGRIWFTLIFAGCFALVLVFAYWKDIKIHRKYFKNAWVVLLAVLLFLAIFLFLKRKFIGV